MINKRHDYLFKKTGSYPPIFKSNIIKSKFHIINIDDPCYKLKSVKNSSEIKHMINAHVEDGVALTKFIYWIKNINKKK